MCLFCWGGVGKEPMTRQFPIRVLCHQWLFPSHILGSIERGNIKAIIYVWNICRLGMSLGGIALLNYNIGCLVGPNCLHTWQFAEPTMPIFWSVIQWESESNRNHNIHHESNLWIVNQTIPEMEVTTYYKPLFVGRRDTIANQQPNQGIPIPNARPL